MFKGKTILITGASSGLGRCLAGTLSKEKANLVLLSRNKTELEQTKSFCNTNTIIFPGDVSDINCCKEGIEKSISLFGSLDYVIVNAGISMWSKFENLEDPSIIRKIMETNYLGAVNIIFYALPYLKKSNGMIVGISSIQGKIPVPYHSGYSASKHALDAFLDVLRLELKNQVNVLTVSPGWIKDTNLKKNALHIERHSVKPHRDEISLDFTANRIIQSMLNKKQQLIIPSKYRILPWLRLISPKLFSFIMNREFKE